MIYNQGQNFINTFTVTTANDENDGINKGTGLSLREAVDAANNSAGTDRIIFDSSLSGSNIILNMGEIAIADSVEVVGLGEDALTINGANASRIFKIDDGNAETAIEVSLSDLTLTNGMSSDIGGAIINQENLQITNSTITGSTAETRGGAIYNSGNLVVRDSIVSDSRVNQRSGGGIFSNGDLSIQNSIVRGNHAQGNGGGISNFQGTLNIANSTIDNNSAVQNGGGVGNIGEATISNTLISNNEAVNDGGGGIINVDGNLELINSQVINNSAKSGGGINNSGVFLGGTLSVTNSTISGNVASFAGGGIYNAEIKDTVSIDNSTFSDNQASYGGGISNSGAATISSSTISGNAATISGGGIDNYEGKVDVRNSTISNNSAEAGAGLSNTSGVEFSVTSSIVAGNNNNDLGGDPFTSGGNNLIGNGDGAAGFVAGENADLVGNTDNSIDPRLGVLQDNGGATKTHALLADSPAIGGGSNPDSLRFDQRGNRFTRTNGAIDIGAFENQSLELKGTRKNDILVGASGDDLLEGDKGKDILMGRMGNDVLLGGEDDDRLYGEVGNDLLNGGDGKDILMGGMGNDVLLGDENDDRLYGEVGNDLLNGGDGKDILIGGDGDDILFGGEDSDRLIGGDGSDIFVLEAIKGKDIIYDFQDGTDFFTLGSGMSFEDLSIVDYKNGALIRDTSSRNSAHVFVKYTEAINITAEDFTTI